MGMAHGPRGAQAAFADRLDDRPRGQRGQCARARLPLAAPLSLPRRLCYRRRASSVRSSHKSRAPWSYEFILQLYSCVCAQRHNACGVHAHSTARAGHRDDAGVLRYRLRVRGGPRSARDALARLALVRVPLRPSDAALRVRLIRECSTFIPHSPCCWLFHLVVFRMLFMIEGLFISYNLSAIQYSTVLN